MNILLIFLLVFIIAFIIVFYYERKIKNLSLKLKNNVHFYVARDLDGSLWLFIGKQFRKATTFYTPMPDCWVRLNRRDIFKYFGINKNNFDNLKWEDEPVEVFINMRD